MLILRRASDTPMQHARRLLLFFSLLLTVVLCWHYVVPPFDRSGDPSETLWQDATPSALAATSEWSNRVELADVNADGLVDILFANGGDYATPGVPVTSHVFLNDGNRKVFRDASRAVLGEQSGYARVIKVRDINQDSYADIIIGTTYHTQSQLYLGQRGGHFVNATATHLPNMLLSTGDLEPGDIDGDGDLDLVLVDWGNGNPMDNAGGRCRLWLNDGKGHFFDVTDKQMPDVLVRFSWDLELVDVDNDGDLDFLAASKKGEGSFLFENNGAGYFQDVTQGRLPQFSNNYDFEAMDINGDGYLDLFTINDAFPFAEHVFMNNRHGGFEVSADSFSARDNPWFCDDNAVTFLDVDADRDADLLIASLNCPDRVLLNDGAGYFRMLSPIFSGEKTPGTLGIAVADLDGDHKADVVQAQGEAAFGNRVFMGTHIAPDTASPQIQVIKSGRSSQVLARIHDHKSPSMPQDWQTVELQWQDASAIHRITMQWYGEYLWRAVVPPHLAHYTICATDRAANRSCVAHKNSQ